MNCDINFVEYYRGYSIYYNNSLQCYSVALACENPPEIFAAQLLEMAKWICDCMLENIAKNQERK